MNSSPRTASEHVAQLASCPPELLALITRELLASDVTRIFACGYLVLNRKLLNGGVLEMSVDYSNQESLVWRFNLLRRFKHLRTFRLTSPRRMITGFEWFALELLPKELTTLELNYVGAVRVWIRSISSNVGDPRILIHTVNGKFPFLKSLTLKELDSGWNGGQREHSDPPVSSSVLNWTPDIRENFLKGLPLSLRTLTLSGFGTWRDSDFKLFPRKLTSLTLYSDAYNMSYLPKTLKSISLNYSTNYMAESTIESLPRSITSFSAPYDSFTYSIITCLPKHLLHLRIPAALNIFPISVFANSFHHLLTLEASAWDESSSSNPPVFPPSLTELSLGDWSMTRTFLDTVPRTLQTLHLGTKSVVQDFFGLFLPPKLQTLTLRNNTNLNKDCLHYLPKHVLYFSTATTKFRCLAPTNSTDLSASEEDSDSE